MVDQDLPSTFNRGMLFNVGFLEALKLREDFDCFVFHDVDMLPRHDHCFYRCSSSPKHLTSGVSKWGRKGIPYPFYFGGVVAFSRQQFRSINGASNLYFGWGGEDDDLHRRIITKRYRALRYPMSVGVYDTPEHKRDSGNEGNTDRTQLLKTTVKRQHVEGLNTALYRVTSLDFRPLYVWINVHINATEVFQRTAPDFVMSYLRNSTKLKYSLGSSGTDKKTPPGDANIQHV